MYIYLYIYVYRYIYISINFTYIYMLSYKYRRQASAAASQSPRISSKKMARLCSDSSRSGSSARSLRCDACVGIWAPRADTETRL